MNSKQIYFLMSFVIFASFMFNFVYAPPIYVTVSDELEIISDYQNYSEIIDFGPQKIITNLENFGSVGCVVKIKTEFYSVDETFLGISWSESYPLESGDHNLFSNYWIPKESGQIIAKQKIYMCNEIFEQEPIEFYVENNTFLNVKTFNMTTYSNDYNTINITLITNKSIDSAIIIPKTYPSGWIVEPVLIENIEPFVEKTITLNYIPSIWHSQEIKFNIVELNNNEFSEISLNLLPVEIPKKLTIIDVKEIIVCLVFIIAFLLVTIAKMKRRQKKSKKA